MFEVLGTNVSLLLVVEFVFGFLLGYYSARVIKYMLALFGLITLSTVANLWAVSGVSEDALKQIYGNITEITSIAKKAVYNVSLVVLSGMGAVGIGFIVGALYGFFKGK